jgi:hypothetical protein
VGTREIILTKQVETGEEAARFASVISRAWELAHHPLLMWFDCADGCPDYIQTDQDFVDLCAALESEGYTRADFEDDGKARRLTRSLRKGPPTSFHRIKKRSLDPLRTIQAGGQQA